MRPDLFRQFCYQITLASALLLTAASNQVWAKVPETPRSSAAIKKVSPALSQALAEQQLSLGAAIFMRIFKETDELEVWVEDASGQFKLFRTYPICTFSGDLGPKLAQGDGQSPEGFYFVNAGRMNPWSRFHLSFNLGFPNQYDRYHQRTGDALMVHGNCVSIGCYAMTDAKIEEIYALAQAALNNGQRYFRVHAFPFRMSGINMARYRDHRWYAFWQNLKQGYDHFEQHKRPPNVTVHQGRYVFTRDDS